MLVNVNLLMQLFFVYEAGEQALATYQNILKCLVKITGIPRVSHIAALPGVRQQQRALSFRVAAANAGHVAQIHPVHSDQVTLLLLILAGHLPGRMSIAADAMLRQFASDRWIHRVAQFFPAGCCGSNHELIFPPQLSHQVLHHILCHRATADIAEANE